MAKDAEQDWRAEAGRRFKEKQQKGRFKLVEGENTIRILPRVSKGKSRLPFFEYNVHREVGPNKRFVRCGKDVHGEGDCWLCDEKIPSLANSGDAGKERRAANLAMKEQFVVQVATVDTDTGKMSGPFLWTVPTGGARSLAARLLGVLKSTKRDYVDPEEGYNLTIERTGTGKTDTNYSQPIPDEEPSKVPEKILNLAKPFSALIPAYSEEQQKAAYFGRDEREAELEEEEAEEETKPKRGRAAEDEEETEEVAEDEEERPRGKKKPHAEEDEEEAATEDEDEAPPQKKKKPIEDDEEETEAEPEEDEEERPHPKKKARQAEEEEEEPAEDEDEEPAPKKKKKAVAEEEEESEPEEGEDEDEKPRKKTGKNHVEEEEEEPEERPAKKKKPRPSDDD